MPTSLRNGVFVVEEAADFKQVERDLGRLDDRLFLIQEWQRGRPVYCVMVDFGDRGAHELTRWLDDRGDPLPLSSGLVEKVKSLRPRSGRLDLLAARRENERYAARENERTGEVMEDIADDMAPKISGRRSAVLPRGQHLRLARSRSRYHDRRDLR